MESQKTIAKEFSLEGNGLQTGKPVKMLFLPEKSGMGITFVRHDLEGKPSVKLGNLFSFETDRRSSISFGPGYVETIEHILAALWGAGIDNIRIELDSSEPPALDGSAAEFLKAIEKAGVKEQNTVKEYIELKEPVWAESGESFLGAFPSSSFKISYVLEYPNPVIGRQFFGKVLTQDIFREEIAPARTFCLKEEAETLIKSGYGKGADLKNTLVMDQGGPIGTSLRFPDEPVRHKVLDLIGDLYLLGKPLKGRIIAVRSGHKLNLELVKKIKELS